MTITLQNALVYIGIISFAAGLIKYTVVSPLNASIAALSKSIEKLDTKISIMSETIDNYRERLVIVETSTKSAHKRIDGHDDILNVLVGKNK